MASLNLDLDYFSHPKVRRLVGLLGKSADIYPIRIWAHCGKHHPADGYMKDYSGPEVEAVAGWEGDPGKLLEALERVNLLKKNGQGYVCHDWEDHEGHLIAFKKRGTLAAKARWKRYIKHTSSKHQAMQSGIPSNAPTLPNHTIPNLTKDIKDGGTPALHTFMQHFHQAIKTKTGSILPGSLSKKAFRYAVVHLKTWPEDQPALNREIDLLDQGRKPDYYVSMLHATLQQFGHAKIKQQVERVVKART